MYLLTAELKLPFSLEFYLELLEVPASDWMRYLLTEICSPNSETFRKLLMWADHHSLYKGLLDWIKTLVYNSFNTICQCSSQTRMNLVFLMDMFECNEPCFFFNGQLLIF